MLYLTMVKRENKREVKMIRQDLLERAEQDYKAIKENEISIIAYFHLINELDYLLKELKLNEGKND